MSEHDIVLISADDIGNDVLHVRAYVNDLRQPIEARGWVSATTNHFDASAYDDGGNLKDGATPRAMTSVEAREYCVGLVRDEVDRLIAEGVLATAQAAAPTAQPLVGIVDEAAAAAAAARIADEVAAEQAAEIAAAKAKDDAAKAAAEEAAAAAASA